MAGVRKSKKLKRYGKFPVRGRYTRAKQGRGLDHWTKKFYSEYNKSREEVRRRKQRGITFGQMAGQRTLPAQGKE